VDYEIKALELDPLSAIGIMSLGDLYTMLGQFDEALTSYRKAIEIEPSMPMPYLGIGSNEAYVNGNIVAAIPWLERATVLDTSNPALAANVMLAYLDLGDIVTARNRLARAQQEVKRAGDHFLGNIQAVLALYEGRDAEAASIARQTLAADPGDHLTETLVRNALLRDGRRSEARVFLAASCPGLGHEEPAVDRSCYRAAIDLALVLQQEENAGKAATLLDRAEAVIAGMPRLSWAGFGLADVQIHALRGHRSQALESLRRAQHDRWRGPLWRYYRDIDPNLESIRTEPEFKAVFADIERDMARQRTELAARAKDAPLDLGSVR
jgi:tetratricopeptide (TPR) repeat protein